MTEKKEAKSYSFTAQSETILSDDNDKVLIWAEKDKQGALIQPDESKRPQLIQEKSAIFQDENPNEYEFFTSSVERDAKRRNLDLLKSDFLSPFMITVLKSELYVMLQSHANQHYSHFLKTHSETVITAIHNRLLANGSYVRKDKIRGFLNRLFHIFSAKEARGENISALAFWLEEQEAENKRKENREKLAPKKKSKGRPRKRVQGHKVPMMGYPSIAEAARQTGESYPYLRRQALKDNAI